MTEYLRLPEAAAIAADMGLHVRDLGLLSSALARPESAMFGVEAYPDLFAKAAALMSSLAQNHPFFDDNKRFSWVATLTSLELNDAIVEMPTDVAFEFVLNVAQSRLDVAEIAEILRAATTV
ncbi:type II toxin-antitoxin system death-on-curing family toxin [Microbacterium sp. NPDC056044]|uniref:type II toxin-antitoxin system death-on-curing family toxin n=1 Tax=Microbacterium sp. NPDC056044 TaxID=3345690 RepID=UPI0035DE90B6